ncbi:MAG: hypothetical protein ACLQIB_02590 [Isosphaeraceae bacterium]
MKLFNAIGRQITNPLFAVIVCAGGACAIWFGLGRVPESAPKAHLAGAERTDHPAVKDGQTGADEGGKSLATKTDGAPESPKAPSGIAARRPRQPRMSIGEGKADVIVFEATNEPVPFPPAVGAIDHRQATGQESVPALTAETIGPRDPRAKAMSAYQLRNVAVPDDVMSQKRMANWCDEQGLWDAAKTHWEAVLRLVPNQDEARKRLGFRWRGGKWVFDAASADEIAQRKANAYWEKELKKLHTAMRCRTRTAVPARALAVAQVESVGDPLAAGAIWNVFAADAGHHGMMAGILRRFNTRKASQMLAALAVYSPDRKAQVAAVAALHGRGPADYGERLVALMHAPLRVEERQVLVSGGAPARQLFVEGDSANYRLLFMQALAPASQSFGGPFQPRISASQIAMARQFNGNQATVAKQAVDQQVELAKQTIARYNESINALNERVARVLNEACGAGIRPEPEDGRRWLALALGTQYQSAADRPKPTFTEVVAPLYNPTFLPVPVAC